MNQLVDIYFPGIRCVRTADILRQVAELLRAVQHLDTLGVRVVPQRKGFGYGRGELPAGAPEYTKGEESNER